MLAGEIRTSRAFKLVSELVLLMEVLVVLFSMGALPSMFVLLSIWLVQSRSICLKRGGRYMLLGATFGWRFGCCQKEGGRARRRIGSGSRFALFEIGFS